MTDPHHGPWHTPDPAGAFPAVTPGPHTPPPQTGATYQGGIYQRVKPAWPPPAAPAQPSIPQPPRVVHHPVYVTAPPQIHHVAVTTRIIGRGPNHLLHGLLTLFTCGLWLPVWVGVAIFGRRR